MNQSLRHRGPDDSGVWLNGEGNVCFGHTRLSIIDLSSGGHQPMSVADGTTISFNGEIYNYARLRSGLKSHSFRSASDTEVLLALYKEKGEDFLQDLTGMFALAIWNPADRSVFLARDRIGKKPLYYSIVHGIFSFSSEIRSLLTLPWISHDLDENSVENYLTYGFCPPPKTMFKDILKVPEGCSVWYDGDAPPRIERFWNLQFKASPTSEEVAQRIIREEAEKSVRLRMVSDVPVGVFLSGGVDSSALAHMMRKRTSEQINSFTIGFADQPNYDETKAAAQTAKELGFQHHEYIVTPTDLRNTIGKMAEVFDDPLCDPTSIPIFFLCQMAKSSSTKVVLTGDGPDELFLGYSNWQKYLRFYAAFRRYQSLPQSLRDIALSSARFVVPDGGRWLEMMTRGTHNQELFWGSAPSFRQADKMQLFSGGFMNRKQQRDAYEPIQKIRDEFEKLPSTGSRNRDADWMTFLGVQFVIPNYYLHRADRVGMYHSLELRTPFLDHNFVTAALSIDPRWKYKDGVGKSVFKSAFRDAVSQRSISESKKGFCVPVREWGGEVMVEYIGDNIKLLCEDRGWFTRSGVESQLKKFQLGSGDATNNLWSLYFLIAWLERWA